MSSIPLFDIKENNKNESTRGFVLLFTVSLLLEPFGSRFVDV